MTTSCLSPRTGADQRPRTRTLVLMLFGVAWILGIVVGMGALVDYSSRPGAAGEPPARFPEDALFRRDPNRATLVMAAHPYCPCTRASIGELARIMRHGQGLVSGHVLFFKPREMPDGWEQSDLWASAAAIPGVDVISDVDGVEARRFGAATSGAVLVYDTSGQLMFHGGITSQRGHSGDNTGQSSIIALLTEGHSLLRQTPVYGCSLFDRGDRGSSCTESGGQPCHP